MLQKVRLSSEDLPLFEQMVSFLAKRFFDYYKEEQDPINLSLEFDNKFGNDVNMDIKQKVAFVAILKMKQYFIPDELKQLYYTYLKEMVSLAQQLNLDGPLEYAVLFTYLLHNGNISLNGKFNFKMPNKKQDNILPIISIFQNKGVCRNHAVACSDFINFAFANNEQIISTIETCKYKKAKRPIMQTVDKNLTKTNNTNKLTQISSFKLFKSSIQTLFTINNHMFTLIKDDNHIFGIDCTNRQIVKIFNGEIGKSFPTADLKSQDYILDNELNHISAELYNNGNSEYYMINALLSTDNFSVLDNNELDLRFISALEKISVCEYNEHLINSFSCSTKNIREEMLSLISNLKIPLTEDLLTYCLKKILNQDSEFFYEFLSIDYTTERQLTKK